MASPTDPPPLPASFTRADLESVGFSGWGTWAELRDAELVDVPSKPGAYVVYRPSTAAPEFIHPSPAGWFKGEDPTVSIERLNSEWVDGAHVVYIGKADFRSRRKTVEALRERLGEFSLFGAGKNIGHRGGRLIWQLADAKRAADRMARGHVG